MLQDLFINNRYLLIKQSDKMRFNIRKTNHFREKLAKLILILTLCIIEQEKKLTLAAEQQHSSYANLRKVFVPLLTTAISSSSNDNYMTNSSSSSSRQNVVDEKKFEYRREEEEERFGRRIESSPSEGREGNDRKIVWSQPDPRKSYSLPMDRILKDYARKGDERGKRLHFNKLAENNNNHKSTDKQSAKEALKRPPASMVLFNQLVNKAASRRSEHLAPEVASNEPNKLSNNVDNNNNAASTTTTQPESANSNSHLLAVGSDLAEQEEQQQQSVWKNEQEPYANGNNNDSAGSRQTMFMRNGNGIGNTNQFKQQHMITLIKYVPILMSVPAHQILLPTPINQQQTKLLAQSQHPTAAAKKMLANFGIAAKLNSLPQRHQQQQQQQQQQSDSLDYLTTTVTPLSISPPTYYSSIHGSSNEDLASARIVRYQVNKQTPPDDTKQYHNNLDYDSNDNDYSSKQQHLLDPIGAMKQTSTESTKSTIPAPSYLSSSSSSDLHYTNQAISNGQRPLVVGNSNQQSSGTTSKALSAASRLISMLRPSSILSSIHHSSVPAAPLPAIYQLHHQAAPQQAQIYLLTPADSFLRQQQQQSTRNQAPPGAFKALAPEEVLLNQASSKVHSSLAHRDRFQSANNKNNIGQTSWYHQQSNGLICVHNLIPAASSINNENKLSTIHLGPLTTAPILLSSPYTLSAAPSTSNMKLGQAIAEQDSSQYSSFDYPTTTTTTTKSAAKSKQNNSRKTKFYQQKDSPGKLAKKLNLLSISKKNNKLTSDRVQQQQLTNLDEYQINADHHQFNEAAHDTPTTKQQAKLLSSSSENNSSIVDIKLNNVNSNSSDGLKSNAADDIQSISNVADETSTTTTSSIVSTTSTTISPTLVSFENRNYSDGNHRNMKSRRPSKNRTTSIIPFTIRDKIDLPQIMSNQLSRSKQSLFANKFEQPVHSNTDNAVQFDDQPNGGINLDLSLPRAVNLPVNANDKEVDIVHSQTERPPLYKFLDNNHQQQQERRVKTSFVSASTPHLSDSTVNSQKDNKILIHYNKDTSEDFSEPSSRASERDSGYTLPLLIASSSRSRQQQQQQENNNNSTKKGDYLRLPQSLPSEVGYSFSDTQSPLPSFMRASVVFRGPQQVERVKDSLSVAASDETSSLSTTTTSNTLDSKPTALIKDEQQQQKQMVLLSSTKLNDDFVSSSKLRIGTTTTTTPKLSLASKSSTLKGDNNSTLEVVVNSTVPELSGNNPTTTNRPNVTTYEQQTTFAPSSTTTTTAPSSLNMASSSSYLDNHLLSDDNNLFSNDKLLSQTGSIEQFGRISESLQTNPLDLIDLQNSRSSFELPSQLESLSMFLSPTTLSPLWHTDQIDKDLDSKKSLQMSLTSGKKFSDASEIDYNNNRHSYSSLPISYRQQQQAIHNNRHSYGQKTTNFGLAMAESSKSHAV